MTPGGRVAEVKQRLVGPTERFACELVYRAPHLLIARYRVRRPPWGGLPLDSYGCFWARRPYLAYHMVRPRDGAEAVTRFDVIRPPLLAADAVTYVDLALDLWTEPGSGDAPAGLVRWEDEAEVRALRRRRLLTPADEVALARARRVLGDGGHRRVVREVRALLRRVGALPT